MFNDQFYAIRLIIIDDEPLPGTKEEEVQNIIKDAEQAAAKKMNAETMKEIEDKRIIKLKILEDRLKKFTSKTDDTKKSSIQASIEAIRSIAAASAIVNKVLGIK